MPMKPKTCIKIDNLAFPIELQQVGARFRVIYGQQVKSNLSYSEACDELGTAMMHAAACDGLIETRPLRLAA